MSWGLENDDVAYARYCDDQNWLEPCSRCERRDCICRRCIECDWLLEECEIETCTFCLERRPPEPIVKP